MAKKDFISKDGTRKYVSGGRVRLNGSPVRQWGLYKSGDNCWIYQGVAFLSISATRSQIEARFEEA